MEKLPSDHPCANWCHVGVKVRVKCAEGAWDLGWDGPTEFVGTVIDIQEHPFFEGYFGVRVDQYPETVIALMWNDHIDQVFPLDG